MVLHESNPGFPLISPSYLMAVNFTAFDLAAYIYKNVLMEHYVAIFEFQLGPLMIFISLDWLLQHGKFR